MLNECHFNNRISNYLLPLILFLVLPLFVYYMYILKIFIFLLTYITSQANVFLAFFHSNICSHFHILKFLLGYLYHFSSILRVLTK